MQSTCVRAGMGFCTSYNYVESSSLLSAGPCRTPVEAVLLACVQPLYLCEVERLYTGYRTASLLTNRGEL